MKHCYSLLWTFNFFQVRNAEKKMQYITAERSWKPSVESMGFLRASSQSDRLWPRRDCVRPQTRSWGAHSGERGRGPNHTHSAGGGASRMLLDRVQDKWLPTDVIGNPHFHVLWNNFVFPGPALLLSVQGLLRKPSGAQGNCLVGPSWKPSINLPCNGNWIGACYMCTANCFPWSLRAHFLVLVDPFPVFIGLWRKKTDSLFKI